MTTGLTEQDLFEIAVEARRTLVQQCEGSECREAYLARVVLALLEDRRRLQDALDATTVQAAKDRDRAEAADRRASEARAEALEEAAQDAKRAVLAWMMGKGPSGDCDGYVAGRVRALAAKGTT